MKPDEFLPIFQQTVSFSPAEEAKFLAAWTHKRSLKRGEDLVPQGSREDKLYFIRKGALRIFFPHQGEEICVGFGYPGTLIVSYFSFLRGIPSDYTIQAIRQSELIGISREDFHGLLEEIPKLERSWRLLTEEALMGKIEREVEMLTFTPQQRLERLLARSPHLFQHIPKKYIASYLRMTPETLSRIKIP